MAKTPKARKPKDPRMEHLQWNGRNLRVRVPVPDEAQGKLGKKVLTYNLDTDSLTEANRRKGPIVKELLKKIKDAAQPGYMPPDPMTELGLSIRAIPNPEKRIAQLQAELDSLITMRQRRLLDPELPEGYVPPTVLSEEKVTRDGHTYTVREIIEPEGNPRLPIPDIEIDYTEPQKHLVAVATGKATPLDYLHSDFILSEKIEGRRAKNRRQSLRELLAWLQKRDTPHTVEAIDRETAGQFNMEMFVKRDRSFSVHHPMIAGLKHYWEWMIAHGHAKFNPWDQIRVRAPRSTGRQTQPRAFRDPELIALFQGNPKLAAHRSFYDSLLPAMAIAAVTGAGIGGIYSLNVRDCLFDSAAINEMCDELDIPHGKAPHGVIYWRRQKTDASERLCPIHPLILPLIKRLMRDTNGKPKGPDELLLKEGVRPSRSPKTVEDRRGSTASFQFTKYRRALGINDVPPGARQSRVLFHSFRKYVARVCIQALTSGATGYTLYTVEQCIGHKTNSPKSETMQYAGLSDMTARVACIGAITLPAPVTAIIKKLA